MSAFLVGGDFLFGIMVGKDLQATLGSVWLMASPFISEDTPV